MAKRRRTTRSSGMTDSEQLVFDMFVDYGFKVFRNGLPDFLVCKDGKAKFVEVKRYDDRLRKHQAEVFKDLVECGFCIDLAFVREDNGICISNDAYDDTKGMEKMQAVANRLNFGEKQVG